MNPPRIPQGFIQFCIKFEYFKRNPTPVARTNVLQLFNSSLMKQSDLVFPQMELSFMNNPLSSEPSPRSSKRKNTSDTDTPTSTDKAPPSKNRKTTSEDQYMEIEQDSNVHESTDFESKTGDANDFRNITLQSVKTSPNQLELQIHREIRELEEKFQAQKKFRTKKTLQFKLLELRNNKTNGNMPRQTLYDELQKEKPAQEIGYLKQIGRDDQIQLSLDDYGFLTSWTFENQEDVETDEIFMKDAPKIQLFYLSKNDKKKNDSIWRAIKERRIKRWIVFDYNYVPEPDDFMYLEGDIIYGDIDDLTKEDEFEIEDEGAE
ncbi:hypothetical protein CAEBREN_05014 [Caenorhabditis brenneri]|uniref:Uncharacterized protein n=1 Tax=Caenorhabditis brenneri TaxID=135651 RepID=G0NLY1_CAEBE|nr:hypothetical protein CAEBREN_05014 [Caenorhabditis brenneri]